MNLFLVGAGFTHAALGDKAPLNDQLLERVAGRMKDNDSFSKYRMRFGTDRIEEFLTYLDLEVQRGVSEASKLRVAINETIAEICVALRFKLESLQANDWVSTFINSVLRHGDVLVSLNYDCYLEGALDHFDAWSPNGGYPEPIQSFFADSYPPNTDRKAILLYKIHGSENFRASPIAGNADRLHVGVALNPGILPKASAYSHFGGGVPDLGAHLIAPSYIKIPDLQLGYLMRESLQQAAKAKNLVIVGCGMRREDSFLYLLVTHFMGRDVTGKKIVILDSAADAVAKRLESYFGRIGGLEVKSLSLTLHDGMTTLQKVLCP